MCGYTDQVTISKFSNVISTYINEAGKEANFQGDQDILKTADNVVWTRKDVVQKALFEKQSAEAAAKATLLTPKEQTGGKPTAPVIPTSEQGKAKPAVPEKQSTPTDPFQPHK